MSAEALFGFFESCRLQLANGLRKLVGRKISLDQQIVGGGKIRIELERLLKLCLGCIPFSFRGQDLAFKKMGGRRIGRFLELALYPLPGSVEMLVQQVQLDELIDQPQVIRRELGSFFKCLARFVISFRLAEGQTERYLGLWILAARALLAPRRLRRHHRTDQASHKRRPGAMRRS